MTLKYFIMFFLMITNTALLGRQLLRLAGCTYWTELVIALLFAFTSISVLGMLKRGSRCAHRTLALYFPANLLNFTIIYLMSGGAMMLALSALVNITGFSVAAYSLESKRDEKYARKIKKKYEKIAKELEPISKGQAKVILECVEPEVMFEKKANKPARKSKGVFVASRNAKLYHTKECTALNFLKPKNRIWLKNSEDARKKGYRKHSCVK